MLNIAEESLSRDIEVFSRGIDYADICLVRNDNINVALLQPCLFNSSFFHFSNSRWHTNYYSWFSYIKPITYFC